MTYDIFVRLPQATQAAVLKWLEAHAGTTEAERITEFGDRPGSYLVRTWDSEFIVEDVPRFPVLWELVPATEEVTAGAGSEEVS